MKKLLIAFLLGTNFLMAQEPALLTLPEAINYALEHKADAEKARLDVENANAQIAEVRASALPKITVTGGTTFNPLLQQNILPVAIFGTPGEDILVAFGRKWNSNANAQVSQTLFNQQVFTGLKAARSTKEFYQLNAQLTQEEIIEKVATAYYQVYESKQNLLNLERNLELTEKTVEIVEGLFKNGLAKKIDFDRSTVALNNLIANRQQVINAVDLRENALKFMIGMSIAREIQLPDQKFQPAVLPGANPDVAERTELQLMEKQIELLNWQKKATIAEYYPSLSFVANYGWLGQGDEIPLWNGKDQGVFWSDLASVGVNLQIPIFNGFATKSRVKQNQIAIDKARADFEEIELALDMEYRNSLSQLENSLLTINIQEENVELAQEVLEDTQNNYGLGLASLNDMLDAERDLAEARNNLTNAQINYKLAEVALLKSQGILETLKENNL